MNRSMLAFAVMIAACGKSGGAAAEDPQAVARAFVEAIAAGDLDKARGMLPTDAACAACAAAPGSGADRCKKSAQAMRDQIGALVDDFPRGAHVTGIKKSDEQMPGMDMWTVELDGKPAAEIMTVSMGGHVYPTFPVKRKKD